MNERIRELADEAGIPAIDGEWDYNDRTLLVKDNGEWRAAVPSEIISTMIQSERGLNKFAELIVRECADLLKKEAESSHDEGTETYNLLLKESKWMKKHFGVEE